MPELSDMCFPVRWGVCLWNFTRGGPAGNATQRWSLCKLPVKNEVWQNHSLYGFLLFRFQYPIMLWGPLILGAHSGDAKAIAAECAM